MKHFWYFAFKALLYRFGNIQKYLIQHRNSFVNQIDPKTGNINFKIGSEFMSRTSGGQLKNFATEREEVENSANYNRNIDGYLSKKLTIN